MLRCMMIALVAIASSPNARAEGSQTFPALERLPQPSLPFSVEAAPLTKPPAGEAGFALPEPPPVVVGIPPAPAPVTTASAAPRAAHNEGFALPGLPAPGDVQDTILSADVSSPAPAITAAPVEAPAPDLPAPPDPNAAIAMLAPRPAAPAPEPSPAVTPPAAPPAATPAMPAATPAPLPAPTAPAATALSPEALDSAFATIGKLHSWPAGVSGEARAFYAKRNLAPLWTDGGALNAPARRLLAKVQDAASHGLAPARFRRLTDALAAATTAEDREAAVALIAVAYARDARGARINPQTISRLITAEPAIPDADEILAVLAGAPAADTALEAFNPRHAGYAALRKTLAALSSGSDDRPKLRFGPILTQGMSDARVPLVREALGLPALDSLVLDGELVAALRSFQREKGIRPTGRLDRATTAALGGMSDAEYAARNPHADIIANMERWRWLPPDLGADHVFVNVPDFSLSLVRGGRETWGTRVIVGKPETQTPIFSHRMQFVVVNPSWNVPPSIALKEYLPLLQKNPHALAARGLQVVSRGKVVDPSTVDWTKVGRSVAIRQPPGERNALGNIKFMFPNQHAVYLHDTPNRSLFSNERRAYSHGCVRVLNPFALAEAVMGPEWSEQRLRGLVGRGERQINLPEDLPVHLAYFTTYIGADGNLHTRDDLYGHNRKVKAQLGL